MTYLGSLKQPVSILYESKIAGREFENERKHTKRALITSQTKRVLLNLPKNQNLVGIIHRCGTKAALDNAGVKTIAIDDVTAFRDDGCGRVRPFHPNIHGGLLARRLDVVTWKQLRRTRLSLLILLKRRTKRN